MTISVNDHKVLRSFFTNHYSTAEVDSSVAIDRVDESNEPSGLPFNEVVSVLGSLQRKKLVMLHRMGTHTFVYWTRKGLKKAESIGPFDYDTAANGISF